MAICYSAGSWQITILVERTQPLATLLVVGTIPLQGSSEIKSMNTYRAELVFSEALPDGLHSLEHPWLISNQHCCIFESANQASAQPDLPNPPTTNSSIHALLPRFCTIIGQKCPVLRRLTI